MQISVPTADDRPLACMPSLRPFGPNGSVLAPAECPAMPKLGPSEPTLATRPWIRRRRLGRLQVLRAGGLAIGALDAPL